MGKLSYSFIERINGITFIVSMKSDDNANKSVNEYVEELITKQSMDIEPDYS